MSVLKDITNKKFGRLTAIEYVGSTEKGCAKWLFSCECGNSIVATARSVKRKKPRKSCGCLNRSITHGHTRGGKASRTYKSWHLMIQRCCNPNNEWYCYYGGRGITVCARWLYSFENFLEDMGERQDGESLERMNYNDGYNPQNCKWANSREQALNRRYLKSTSGYRGVTKRRNKWQAYITIHGKETILGSYKTPQLAVKARNAFILKNNLTNEYPVQNISKNTKSNVNS